MFSASETQLEEPLMSADVDRIIDAVSKKIDVVEQRINMRFEKVNENVHDLRSDLQKIATASALHEQSLENGRRSMEAHTSDIRQLMTDHTKFQQQIVLKVDKDALATFIQALDRKLDTKTAEETFVSKKMVVWTAVGFFLAGGGSVFAALHLM